MTPKRKTLDIPRVENHNHDDDPLIIMLTMIMLIQERNHVCM